MRSLAAVAELGSILAASQRCCLSPGAVHKHLRTLEDELGSPVYEKREGRLALTQAGELALPFVREILAQYEAVFATMRGWKEAKRGLVRVGAGPTFSSYLLPKLVKRFRRGHPGVEVFVETGGSGYLMERLSAGALDLIFDIGAGAAAGQSHIEQVAAWLSPAAFIAGKDASAARQSLARLEKQPFILFQKGTRMESIVQAYFDTLNFRPKVVMRSDSSEAIKSMVRAGLGVSVLFQWNVSAEGRTGDLRVLRCAAPALNSYMVLLRMKTGYVPRPVEAFVAMARRSEWKDLTPLSAS